MGRNKTRSRAVDVTKSLLQPTSITDHIAVQVSPNVVIHVAEDDLSPTQGSEAAFALRREGKLDTTTKLCLNWRQGNCHNHAACSYAHVFGYFGVSGDAPNSATTGRSAVHIGAAGAGGGPARSGGATAASGAGSNASWSQKLSPPSYPAAPIRTATTAARGEDATTASSATTAAPPVAAASAPLITSPTTAASTEAAAGSTAAAEPVAESAPSTSVPATAAAADSAETPKTMAAAPPTPASTTVDTPHAGHGAASGPPAVLAPEALRNILLSLATTANNTTPPAKETAEAEGSEEDAEMPPHHPMTFLAEKEAAAMHAPVPAWLHATYTTPEDLINGMGKLVCGSYFDLSIQPENLISTLRQMRDAKRQSADGSAQSCSEADRSPGVEYPMPLNRAAATGPEQLFSTSPATVASATLGGLSQHGGARAPLSGARAGGREEGEMPVPGELYHHFINSFNPEE